jgi:hypothetical protein
VSDGIDPPCTEAQSSSMRRNASCKPS